MENAITQQMSKAASEITYGDSTYTEFDQVPSYWPLKQYVDLSLVLVGVV